MQETSGLNIAQVPSDIIKPTNPGLEIKFGGLWTLEKQRKGALWANFKCEFFWSLKYELEKKRDLPCPGPISRLRVEKVEGGLVVAGVVVAANCQVALPVFGCLFILVGIVLTVASYRGPGQDEAPENYAARLAFTGNSRILGPACIGVGVVMLTAGITLCLLARRARKKEKRVGFHCPIHGDFYPLSPVTASKALGQYDTTWSLCFGNGGNLGANKIPQTPPQCPHTQFSSTRSSFSSAPVSPCPTPMPFLVTSNSISSDIVNSMGANISPDQTFGSIRSLSVSREVASFPLSRTPSPPFLEEKICIRSGSLKGKPKDCNSAEINQLIENDRSKSHIQNSFEMSSATTDDHLSASRETLLEKNLNCPFNNSSLLTEPVALTLPPEKLFENAV